MINITDKSKCTGCSACYSACPVSCIQMQMDDEGFYYPVADTQQCVGCGKCERVCPVLNGIRPEKNIREVYICQNKSLEIRRDSTSGGVFSALSQYVLDRGGIVFGAELDDKFCVRHGRGETAESLERFRGSKYVQSWMEYTFRAVQDELKKDRWVLFSGTPCQVAGLNAFLGKRYEKLILMDIVCYSISSPGVWEQFLDKIGQKVPLNQVKRIKFRDKTKFGYEYTLMTFYDKNGKVLYSAGPESNPMLRSFVSNTSTRPSCYDCKFKTVDRVSDFTAWDCYNVYKYDKQLDDNQGTSHLMVHSDKGMAMLDEISRYLSLREVDTDQAIASEPAMTECAHPSDMRGDFFATYKDGGNVFEVFFQDTRRVKVERFLRQGLSSMGLYKYAKRMMKG